MISAAKRLHDLQRLNGPSEVCKQLERKAERKRNPNANRTGKPPYGYDVRLDEHRRIVYTINTAEYGTLMDIYECRRKGMTIQAIADKLNKTNATTRSGKPWSVPTVDGILRRDKHTKGRQ